MLPPQWKTILPSEITYENEGRIAVITINRPEQRNALNLGVRQGLGMAFNIFEQDEESDVAILTGSGDKAFCAGGDLKEMKENSLKVPPKDFVPHLERTHYLTKPIIAAVNGMAYAGGWLLAQMCDLCIAAENATFAITEAKVGRGVPWSTPLAWMIPPRVMMEILLTAEPISAQRAYEIGFVNKVVPQERLLEAAKQMAEKIASNAPLTVKAAKQIVYQSMEMGRSAALNVADHIFEPVYLSEDAQEGPRAFAEKRKPNWSNR